MKPVIGPIPRELLERELATKEPARPTNNGSNLIYSVNASDSPDTMREIGRLRELAFREAGGGTGREVDIDELDLAEEGYEQLIVWDPAAREIVGGYRYIICDGTRQRLSTEHYFRFSDNFREKYLPHTIELGRSFIQPQYQRSRTNPKSIYSLDNLWDGLGWLMKSNPGKLYFFGKVTMYGDYNREARDMLIFFLRKYFPDGENLIEPVFPTELGLDEPRLGGLFSGRSYAEDYRILSREIRALNENVPPLINSYMSLSPSMKVFGTVRNPDFGNVEETGILITIKDIYPRKTLRHTRDI